MDEDDAGGQGGSPSGTGSAPVVINGQAYRAYQVASHVVADQDDGRWLLPPGTLILLPDGTKVERESPRTTWKVTTPSEASWHHGTTTE